VEGSEIHHTVVIIAVGIFGLSSSWWTRSSSTALHALLGKLGGF